jgi:hypothetical protein
MTQKTWTWKPSTRTLFEVRLADELWFSTLANGERVHHLVHLNYSERVDTPGVRIWSLTLVWLSLHLAFVSKKKEGSA